MRHLKNNEIEILKKLLASNKSMLGQFLSEADRYLVEEMNDGGMGSLKFISDDRDRRWGKTIAELEVKDVDRIKILIALNLDDKGNLFELDVWKVDFSPVIELSMTNL